MFRNTLTANDNYPVQECWNLSSPIQMELYLKPTIFSDFFVSFLESTSILNILLKSIIAIPTLFWILKNVKNVVRQLFKKHRSITPFESQHVKGSHNLVKFASEHSHQIFS